MRVHLELTSQCNFNCAFCPEAELLRPKRGMDWTLLTKILRELADFPKLDFITFHVLGEPLLYPRFFEAVHLSLDLGLPLHLTTNGSTLGRDGAALTQVPIQKIILSLQTPDAQTFELRGAPPKMTAQSYFEGIQKYLHQHLASRSPTKVHLKFMDTSPHPLLTPHRPLDILNSKTALLQEMTRWLTHLGLTADLTQLKPGRWNILPVTETLYFESFPLDNWGDNIHPARWGYCNGGTGQLGILQDGRVIPCCKDYEGVITLGDMRKQTLLEILENDPAQSLIKGFKKLQVYHSHCQRCLGSDSLTKTFLRQGASVLYFKVYKPLQARQGQLLEN